MLVTLIGDEEYHGRDGARRLDLVPGESADVSDATAQRLARDFPDRFEFDGEPGDVQADAEGSRKFGSLRGAVGARLPNGPIMIGVDPARDKGTTMTVLLYMPRDGEEPPADSATAWIDLQSVTPGELYELPFVLELPAMELAEELHAHESDALQAAANAAAAIADLPAGLEPANDADEQQPPAARPDPARRAPAARRARGRRGRRS